MNPMAPLAADSRALDALRSRATDDPRQAIREAAGQFEALFMRQLLKSMRDAIPKSGMWDSPGQAMYTDMFDQQLAQVVAKGSGSLADVIARQLSRNVKGGLDAQAIAPAAQQPVRAGAVAGAVAGPRAEGAAGAAASSAKPDTKRLSAPQAAFVERMWPHALMAERSTGVPAAFIVGQAALESGWGRHEIRNADGSTSHNLFGIKASRGWQGDVARATTTEYVDGRARKQVEPFRAYGSYAEAFTDWASMLAKSPRYAQVLRQSSTIEGFAGGMQKAGYATDPNYGAKLERTINQALMLRRVTT